MWVWEKKNGFFHLEKNLENKVKKKFWESDLHKLYWKNSSGKNERYKIYCRKKNCECKIKESDINFHLRT